jgi:hypothetical protein
MGMGLLQRQLRRRLGVIVNVSNRGGVEGWHCQSLVVILIKLKLLWLHSF